MRKLLIPLVVGLTILVTQVVTGVSAQTPDYSDYETPTPYEPFTEPPSPTPEDNAGECWDCPGSKWQAERPRSSYCSPEALVENPQHLDLCFPEKWAWVCFMEDPTKNIKEHCAMYRRDLDPYGIFATPAPMPTPEPLPTPELTPEPTPTVVPTPEATDTVVAP